MELINRKWNKTLLYLLLTVFTFFLLKIGKASLFDIALFLVLLIGIVISIISLLKAVKFSFINKLLPSKWLLLALFILTTSMPLYEYYQNGGFWGKKVLESAFIDERSRMDLTLFENGKYQIVSNWLIGQESFTGNYKIYKDTIEFEEYPVIDNDFISKKIIIKNNKIYFRQDNFGKYDTTFYYFQIDYEKNRLLKK